MPAPKKKNYSELLKKIRPFIGFDYDLRKPLSQGAKSAITKAARELGVGSKSQSKTIPIRRKRHETNYAYKERVRKLREQTGQRGGHINAIRIDAPSTAKVTIRGTKITVSTASGLKEKIVPFDPIAYLNNPDKYLKGIIASARRGKWQEIQFLHSAHRGKGAIPVQQESAARFLKRRIEKLINKYMETIEHALSGLVFRKGLTKKAAPKKTGKRKTKAKVKK